MQMLEFFKKKNLWESDYAYSIPTQITHVATAKIGESIIW